MSRPGTTQEQTDARADTQRKGPATNGTRPLRVVSLSQLYPGVATRGQGVFVHERLRHLPAERVALEVWRLRPRFPGRGGPRPPANEQVDGVEVRDLPYLYIPRLFKGLDGPMLASRLLRESFAEADLLDAHFGYPAGWAAATVGRRKQLPSVVTFRGSELPFSREPARRRRLVECVQRASGIITVCTFLADLALELGAAKERVHVVGNGIDPVRFYPGDRDEARRAVGLDGLGRILLSVGGLTPRKGVGRVLEVLPRVLREHADLHYVVVGGGGPEGDERQRLELLVQREGLSERVHFVGSRDRDELSTYYRAADAFVLATSNEGWANVLHEAMASGLPVVTTDVGGNSEVLGGGRHGLIVPFGESDALAAGIVAALSETVDLRASTAFARGRTWNTVGEETASVFEAVRGGGR